MTPDLVDALRQADADVVAFYPYLYYPTVAGHGGRDRRPGSCIPAAHDEPALYLPVFGPTYAEADAICYHTAAERRLVQRVHRVAQVPQIVLGLGVGPVVEGGRPGGGHPGHRGPALRGQRGPGRRAQGLGHAGPLLRSLQGAPSRTPGPGPGGPGGGHHRPPRRHRRHRRGRAKPTSGIWCATPWWPVSPSALESFSLVVLEAWEQSVPVMVNATCDPTREHCERSGGGLWFGSFREFEAVLDRLCADAALRALLGRPGPRLRRALLPVAGPHRPLRPLPTAPCAGARAGPPRLNSEPVIPTTGLARGCPRWSRRTERP